MPSGLCIYWLTNNVLTTAQQVYLKSTVKVDTPAIKGGTFVKSEQDDVASSASGDTRRSKQGEKFRARQAALESGGNGDGVDPRGKSKKKKGAKFAQRKAQAQSAKAAGAAPNAGEPTAEKAAETTATAAVEKVKEATEAARKA